MKHVTFSSKEKAEMFDRLSAMFYEKNFGQASKTEIELLMFHFYIIKMIEQSERTDGTIDYNLCSDYKISNDLGITPLRVQSLKLKSHLVHPIEFNWKKSFAKLIDNADYDGNRVKLNIPDPTLMMKIQEFIEEDGGYVETQLNSKILQIKASSFLQLMIAAEPDKSQKELLRILSNKAQTSEKESAMLDKRLTAKKFLDTLVDVSGLALNLKQIFIPQSDIGAAVLNLLTRATSRR